MADRIDDGDSDSMGRMWEVERRWGFCWLQHRKYSDLRSYDLQLAA